MKLWLADADRKEETVINLSVLLLLIGDINYSSRGFDPGFLWSYMAVPGFTQPPRDTMDFLSHMDIFRLMTEHEWKCYVLSFLTVLLL